MTRNRDTFEPWNDPMLRSDPWLPWNDPMRRSDPFEPHNDALGTWRDYSERDRDDIEKAGWR